MWWWLWACGGAEPQWWTIAVDGDRVARERVTCQSGVCERHSETVDAAWTERWMEADDGNLVWVENQVRHSPPPGVRSWDRALEVCDPVMHVWEVSRIREVHCESQAELRSWSSEGETGKAEVRDGRLVWMTGGSLERRRVALEPPRETLEAWGIPVGEWPDARRSRSAVFLGVEAPETPFQQMKTGELWVSHPMPIEVSKETRARFPAWMQGLEGDCQQRSGALIERLRGEGIEAQLRTGVVVQKGELVPHAWVWAKLGDRWVPLDPTLGSGIADAARIDLGDKTMLEVLTQLRRWRRQGVTLRELR